MQLSSGQLPATARRSRTLNFLSNGKKIVPNLAGTRTDKQCLASKKAFDVFLPGAERI